jgi:hypothetical protein
LAASNPSHSLQATYDALIKDSRDQYYALVAACNTFTVFDNANDPYKGNPWEAMRDIRDNKTMDVYGTYDRYGNEVTVFQADKNLLVVPRPGCSGQIRRGSCSTSLMNTSLRRRQQQHGEQTVVRRNRPLHVGRAWAASPA